MLYLSKTLPAGMRALKRARLNDIPTHRIFDTSFQRFVPAKSSAGRMFAIFAVALTISGCKGGTGASDSTATALVQVATTPPPAAAPTPPPPPSPPPPPATSAADATTASLEGTAAIASNFDPATELVTTSIPPSSAPDVVGAFRFVCMPGHLKADDPIVYPGQPGKSHLHQFFGNDMADANSTYASLRASGNSTCMSPLNRSAYWMPAVLNGKGQVVRPDYVTIYYKRRPLSDPIISDPSHPRYQGKGIKLPNGLRFIFGRNMTNLAEPQTGAIQFACDGPGAEAQTHYSNFETAQAGCPVGNRIGVRIEAPDCWDGKNLDSPDHRSHMAYSNYGPCPKSHPYVIPTFTMGAWFTQAAGETYSLVSDVMDTSPGHKRGDTFHADFFMAWDPIVHDMWEKNCIDKMLNCSAGDLGNGKQMKQSWAHSWNANPRLVDMPSPHVH